VRQIRGSRTIRVASGENPVVGLIGLTVMGVGVWGLICATRLLFAAIGFAFTPPTWSNVPGLAVNILENAICGLMTALAIGIVMAWEKKPGSNLPHPELNAAFWGKVVLFASIGWAVGRVAGAAGTIDLPPAMSNSAYVLFSSDKVPLVMFIDGRLGGPGGTDFLSLAFLFLVLLIMIVMLAVLVGTMLHLALYGVAGMTKGGKAYVSKLISSRIEPNIEVDNDTHPVVVGMQRGFIVGVIIGTCEAVFTTWGAATLIR
jgi:hypothetical protein